MIYLDCAATSLQKPGNVAASSCRAIKNLASPGRGCHAPAMDAADCVLDCRMSLCSFFGVDDPDRVVFTFNATHALNIAINSLVSAGDKVVVSGYEHNAVMRPLYALGADVCIARSPLFDQNAALEAFRDDLDGAKCAVCTHVSNVFGFILPIERIAKLCRERGVPLIVDASQSAGVIPIDFSSLGAAFDAMPGHKGLLGPQGTGVLLCGDLPVRPVLQGGTGSNSLLKTMPDYLPDRLEAGTMNVAGIAGLAEGIKYLVSKPEGYVLEHERALRSCFERQISSVRGIKVFSAEDGSAQSGVLSIVSENPGCDTLAELLGGEGVCVRAGLHCAPCAHDTVGTTDTGTVRFSFSPFNTCGDITDSANIFKKIMSRPVNRTNSVCHLRENII